MTPLQLEELKFSLHHLINQEFHNKYKKETKNYPKK